MSTKTKKPPQSKSTEPVDPEEVIAKYVIVRTNDMSWGRSGSKGDEEEDKDIEDVSDMLQVALFRANALGRTRKLRRGVKVYASLYIVREEDRCKADTVAVAAQGGLTLEGFEEGDIIPPFVGDYGNLIGYGEHIDLGTIKA